MNPTALVILNVGFVIIILSAVGNDMQINYALLIFGVVIAAVGAVMLLRHKNSKE